MAPRCFVLFGEYHMRLVIKEFVEHYLAERFHQGIGGRLIRPNATSANDNGADGVIECRSRLGGLLNFYQRVAAVTALRWVTGHYGR